MSQSDLILEYLKAGNKITALEALDKFSCFRLGARIYDLLHEGHCIKSTMIMLPNKKWVAQYWIINNWSLYPVKNPTAQKSCALETVMAPDAKVVSNAADAMRNKAPSITQGNLFKTDQHGNLI